MRGNGVCNVCLVGAGSISGIHAEVLAQLPNVRIIAIVDPNESAAAALAEQWNIPTIINNVENLEDQLEVDCAHVLTPPALHASVAESLLASGVHCFIEKPMALLPQDCESLCELSAGAEVAVGVNQNAVFHPAFLQMKDVLDGNAVGPLRSLVCLCHLPLRQLEARQFGNWMFERPGNIIYELAVHPLSQVSALMGEAENVETLAGESRTLPNGVPFYSSWSVSLDSARCSTQLSFAVGREYPVWQLTAICADGTVQADMIRNRCVVSRRTRWPDVFDHFFEAREVSRTIRRQGRRNVAQYLKAILRLTRRSDAFFLSMKNSIAAFYQALNERRPPPVDAVRAERLVTLCRRIAEAVHWEPPVHRVVPVSKKSVESDIVLLGGTGFIGRKVVRRFLADGIPIRVVARNVAGLGPPFDQPGVQLVRGDVNSPATIDAVLEDARVVVNLAHGGGGSQPGAAERALVGSAQSVAEACLKRGIDRLVHVSSIAALYLGAPGRIVTDDTGADAKPAARAEYARGKILAENLLLELFRQKSLPVCILRPGIVVGEGGVPLHSGIGLFNNPQHCAGWNRGKNPLPFVLVQDVADAICSATQVPDIEGSCFNLVGDVQLPARDYIAELARVFNRPIQYHGQSLTTMWAVEMAKWVVKTISNRPRCFPSARDFRSRGLTSRFDCEHTKETLGWRPVSDRQRFVELGIEVYAEAF